MQVASKLNVLNATRPSINDGNDNNVAAFELDGENGHSAASHNLVELGRRGLQHGDVDGPACDTSHSARKVHTLRVSASENG